MQYDDKALNKYKRMIGPSNKALKSQINKRLKHFSGLSFYKLGVLEDVIVKICCIKDDLNPSIYSRYAYVFAGDHAFTDVIPDKYFGERTIDAVLNIIDKISPLNIFANMENFKIKVIDVGMFEDVEADTSDCVDRKFACGTLNWTKERALSRAEAIKTIVGSLELIVEENSRYSPHIISLGDAGAGNEISSAMILSKLIGGDIFEILGITEDIDTKDGKELSELIKSADQFYEPVSTDYDILDIFSYFGGFEAAAIIGAIMGAALVKLPVVIDGFTGLVSAYIASKLVPEILDYVIIGNQSSIPGSKVIVDELALKPVLSIGMELKEGSGAVLSTHLIEAAFRCYNETGVESIG